MTKPKTFPDPSPEKKITRITSEPTEGEIFLAEKYEPLGCDIVTTMAGFLIRSSVDIARYRRSLVAHPEKVEHYERLIRCTDTAARIRLKEICREFGAPIIDAVATELSGIDWEVAPELPVPEIYSFDNPNSAPDEFRELRFSARAIEEHQSMPA